MRGSGAANMNIHVIERRSLKNAEFAQLETTERPYNFVHIQDLWEGI